MFPVEWRVDVSDTDEAGWSVGSVGGGVVVLGVTVKEVGHPLCV